LPDLNAMIALWTADTSSSPTPCACHAWFPTINSLDLPYCQEHIIQRYELGNFSGSGAEGDGEIYTSDSTLDFFR